MKIIPQFLLETISGGTVKCWSDQGVWRISLNDGDTFDFGILSGNNDLIFDSNGAYHRSLTTMPITITTVTETNAKNLGIHSFKMHKGIGSTFFEVSV